jgi:hypothetical protein
MDAAAQDATQTRLDQLELALLDSKGLRKIPSPDPLIDNYLFRDSLAWIGGQPGSGKSFVAMEMAHAIGTGQDWFSHTTKQGTVLYIVAEGASGFCDRVETWEEHHGTDAHNVQYLPLPIQFADDIDVAATGQLMLKHRYDLVIFDTQARCTVGMKENDSTDMGIFVDKLDRLRKLYGACLLLVHHQPRNGEHLRGSIAMEGAAATVLQVAKAGQQITLETQKQKDIEAPKSFDLQLVSAGKSAVLQRLGKDQKAFAPAEMTIMTTLADFEDEWVAMTVAKATAALPDTTFYRSLNSLVRRNYVQQRGTRPKYLRYIPDQDWLL